MHDSSDTASAGSPTNTIASTGMPVAVTTSTVMSLAMPMQQSGESKISDKIPDMAVVSLVPSSVAVVTPQQPSTGGGPPPAANREDYDSSATVSKTSIIK